MRMVTKLRFGILLAGTLVLAGASAIELVTSLQSGVSWLPIGRRGPVIQFLREESPVGFYSCVAFFAAFGLMALWFASRQVQALLKPKEPENESFVRQQISLIERSSPSGLRPLGVGLALFAAVLFALWLFSA
jgi:hypothetical protein